MKDYATFIKTYINVNECLYFDKGGSYELNLFNMQDAKKHLRTTEVTTYASLLYAMNLLSQVVVTHFPTSIDLRCDSEKDSLFPEIFGILSTADMHVCPAASAAIVIYSAMEEFDGESAPWSQKLEQQVWTESIDHFNNAVYWVSRNLNELMTKLCSNSIKEIKINQVSQSYLEEHQKIKVEILKSPRESSRVINS